MSIDLERAAEALRQNRVDQAEVHAWNALLTIQPHEVDELRRIARALGSANLERDLDARWPQAASGSTSPPDVAKRIPARVPWRRARLLALLVVLVVGVATKVAGLSTESGPVPATLDVVSSGPGPAPAVPAGDGIWLVPLGRVDTIDLDRLAQEIGHTYRTWAGSIAVVPLPRWTLRPNEEQLSSERLIDLLNRQIRASGRATVVGITDFDMRSNDSPYDFALRAQIHYGVVSTARLGADLGARLRGHTRYERVRKLVKRQVEFHRDHGVSTSNPHSLLRPPFSGLAALDEIHEGS